MAEKTPITIKALTWNMGNKEASNAAVNDCVTQLIATDFLPTVIAISTQEELAPNGKRLQDKLLAALNKGLDPNEQYEFIETKDPQFHTTTAGANNSAQTLALSLLTDRNRVSSAVLVKKPFKLENAKARIDYEAGKEKGNKSIITIEGKLTNPETGESLPISISGGHLDSNSDQKRRAHADKFFEKSNIKSDKDKSFNDIYQEASSFKIIMGDFNERDYLMQDGSTQSRANLTNYASYGFDFDKKPTQTQNDGKEISGTYGFKFDSKGNQITNLPDPRGRANVATGGSLDKVTYSSGLEVKSDQYGFTVNEKAFQPNKKGKYFYHGSDHLPVLRDFSVKLPDTNEQAKVVGNYIKQRLPDFSEDIRTLKELNRLKDQGYDSLDAIEKGEKYESMGVMPDAHIFGQLEKNSKAIQFHNVNISSDIFLSQLSGVSSENSSDIREGLMKKLAEKEDMQKNITDLKMRIDGATAANDTTFLEKTFNKITTSNELRNAGLEVMAMNNKDFSAEKKSLFMQSADTYTNLIYQKNLCELTGKKFNNQAELTSVSQKLDKIIENYPEILDKFKKAKERSDNKVVSQNELLNKLQALTSETPMPNSGPGAAPAPIQENSATDSEKVKPASPAVSQGEWLTIKELQALIQENAPQYEVTVKHLYDDNVYENTDKIDVQLKRKEGKKEPGEETAEIKAAQINKAMAGGTWQYHEGQLKFKLTSREAFTSQLNQSLDNQFLKAVPNTIDKDYYNKKISKSSAGQWMRNIAQQTGKALGKTATDRTQVIAQLNELRGALSSNLEISSNLKAQMYYLALNAAEKDIGKMRLDSTLLATIQDQKQSLKKLFGENNFKESALKTALSEYATIMAPTNITPSKKNPAVR